MRVPLQLLTVLLPLTILACHASVTPPVTQAVTMQTPATPGGATFHAALDGQAWTAAAEFVGEACTFDVSGGEWSRMTGDVYLKNYRLAVKTNDQTLELTFSSTNMRPVSDVSWSYQGPNAARFAATTGAVVTKLVEHPDATIASVAFDGFLEDYRSNARIRIVGSIDNLRMTCSPPHVEGGETFENACANLTAEACTEDGLRQAKDAKGARAAGILRTACTAGSARGCDALGQLLRDGRIVDRDLRGAVSAFERGCGLGAMNACQNAGAMHANGGAGDGTETGSTLPVDLGRSLEFHKRACDGGNAGGCMSTGYMYEHGEHVAVDIAKAATLYQKACDAGFGDGCYGLSLLYGTGRGVTKDAGKAARLLLQGCQHKGAWACAELAKRAQAEHKDPCCTLGFLVRACDNGHSQSCMVAGAVCGVAPNEIAAEYELQCKGSTFTGCELLKGEKTQSRPGSL